MAKIDAIDIPKLLMTEGAAPATPAAGKVYQYAKADGLMYSKDDAGTETLMSSGSSGISSGTSNPAQPAFGNNVLFWRTDLGRLVYYDGTRWLTEALYHLSLAGPFDGSSTAIQNGNPNVLSPNVVSRTALWSDDFQAYLVKLYGQTFVATTNDGSNYWTLALSGAVTATAYGNFTTAADTAGTQTRKKATLNVAAGATEGGLILTATKTGSPGNIYVPASVAYRLIVT